MKIALVTPGGFSPDGRFDVIPALLALTAELARRHDVHVFAFGGRGQAVRYPSGGASVAFAIPLTRRWDSTNQLTY